MHNLKKPLMTTSLVLALGLSACSLPTNHATQDQLTQTHDDAWITNPESHLKIQQGLTAYLALDDAFMSIATRLYLIHNAKYSLDLQYYIWEDDSIGHLMLAELLKAADRGVKVRLMIDDQNGTQLDDTLKTLAQHPNFKIKIFNPYKYRSFRVFDYIFRFKNINHRMHNKLIIADGVAAVTGGRNISREYFDASEHFQFTDMDIFFAGTATKQANVTFHQFWNDQLNYDVQQLMGTSNKVDMKMLRQRYSQIDGLKSDKTLNKIKLAQQEVAEHLKKNPIQWAEADFIADSPDKIRGQARDQQLILTQINHLMGKPKNQLELVSAYFVPTTKGTAYLSALSQNNVKVRILTNSFLANDVPVVHAFYQKYRTDLLKNGVKLYEFKPYIERDKRTWYEAMTGNVIPAKGKNASSLHAKFFDVDGKVFIGSFNFDPRSARLNTEVGLVVESAQLQQYISQSLDQYLPHIAYELKLNDQGELIWLEQQKDGTTKTYNVDPKTTKFQRFAMHTVSVLPIEWMM